MMTSDFVIVPECLNNVVAKSISDAEPSVSVVNGIMDVANTVRNVNPHFIYSAKEK